MSEEREIIKSYTVEVGVISVLTNGITQIKFNQEYEIDLPQLSEVQDVIDEISKDGDVYILVTPGPDGNMTKEAREAPMFKNSNTKAIAIIASMLHHRILGNLYFKFKRAKFTNYRLFRNQENAKDWLLLQQAESKL